MREASLRLLSLSPAPAPGTWPPLSHSLPGVTTVPDENPAQWVFLPPDGDWGTHLQVPKGIQPCDLCCIGPSGHIAKIWTLRWKDTMRNQRQWSPGGNGGCGFKADLVTGRNSVAAREEAHDCAMWKGCWIEAVTLERDRACWVCSACAEQNLNAFFLLSLHGL